MRLCPCCLNNAGIIAMHAAAVQLPALLLLLHLLCHWFRKPPACTAIAEGSHLQLLVQARLCTRDVCSSKVCQDQQRCALRLPQAQFMWPPHMRCIV